MAKQTKDNPAVKALQAEREERAVTNEEAMDRMDSSQPTPTQEENDLARLGVHIDEKEPDGSGPTIITKTVVANVPLGYDVKAMEANKPKGQSTSGGSYSREKL